MGLETAAEVLSAMAGAVREKATEKALPPRPDERSGFNRSPEGMLPYGPIPEGPVMTLLTGRRQV